MDETRLGRIVLLVRDFEASVRFYRDILGLAVRVHSPAGWAEFDAGDVLLCLRGPWAGMPYRDADFGKSPDEILFCVSNLKAAIADLESRGVELAPPHEPAQGLWVAEFGDPDGRRIALESRTGVGDARQGEPLME